VADVKCPLCGKRGRYHPTAFSGTWWHPIRYLDCRLCRKEFGIAMAEGVSNEQVKADLEVDKARSRAVDPRLWVGEYWVQVYLRERAALYGIDIVSGIRPTGPDFFVVYKGTPALLEVEVRWDTYLKHGHHLDHRFYQHHRMLAVLHNDSPVPSLHRLLPDDIVYLKADDFLTWKEAEGPRFKREVAELEGGQHTSYEESKLDPETRFALDVQRITRRIGTNEVPECLSAREELVHMLQERNDPRAESLAQMVLPLRSRMAADSIDGSLYLPVLSDQLDELFPERKQEINLKTIRRHYLTRIKGTRRSRGER
jgi:hypothetical protein